jgi:hypothetical protein
MSQYVEEDTVFSVLLWYPENISIWIQKLIFLIYNSENFLITGFALGVRFWLKGTVIIHHICPNG